MKIYITSTSPHLTADGEEPMIRCVEAKKLYNSIYKYEDGSLVGGIYGVGEDCELTEARAREVVRERAGAERDRLLVRVTELGAALDDETWPPVVRV